MAKQIGFLTIGVDQDQFIYIETNSGESISIGSDINTSTFNINTSASPGATPDEATSNFAIDPSANGDIVLQPNGSGASYFTAGDVIISQGDFNIQNGNLLMSGISGTDGQLLIGDSSGNAAWASMISSDASVTITPGANSIDLTVTGGAAADTFPTNSGTANPIAGILNILGGDNMNTEASAANTISINLNEYISWPASTETSGIIYLNSNRFMYAAGTGSTFVGETSGNLTTATSGLGENTCFGYHTGQLLDGTSGGGSRNTLVGYNAGAALTTSITNTVVGAETLPSAVSNANTAVGYQTLFSASSAGTNTAFGLQAGHQLSTGSNNLLIGVTSGGNYTTSESHNICIGSNGVATDGNTIRIGTQGTGTRQQDTTFIAGIYNVTPTGGNDGIVIIDSNGQLGAQTDLLMPNNPAFLENVAAIRTDVTGDGTGYTVVYGTEKFDQDNNFDGTSTFTAPVTGKYLLSFTVFLQQIGVAHTSGSLSIVTSNNTFTGGFGSPAVNADASGQLSLTVTTLADMDASDTATTQVTVSGSTKTVDVTTGGASSLRTMFSGVLVS